MVTSESEMTKRRRRERLFILILFAAYLISFAAIAVVSQIDVPRVLGTVVGVIPPIMATVLTIRLRRDEELDKPVIGKRWRPWITWTPWILVVLVYLLYFVLAPMKGFGYFVTITVIIGVGQLISTARRSVARPTSRRRWLPYAAVAVAALLITGGSVLPDGTWSVIAIALGLLMAVIAVN